MAAPSMGVVRTRFTCVVLLVVCTGTFCSGTGDVCDRLNCGDDKACAKVGQWAAMCVEKPKIGDCLCPAVYAPICCSFMYKSYFGISTPAKFTAGNECDCTCRGGTLCGTVTETVIDTKAKKEPSKSEPQYCSRMYSPVCCQKKDSDEPITAGNKCECGDDGEVKYEGECSY